MSSFKRFTVYFIVLIHIFHSVPTFLEVVLCIKVCTYLCGCLCVQIHCSEFCSDTEDGMTITLCIRLGTHSVWMWFFFNCVCVCVIPPSTVKTAFVEERVEVALRHLLFCVCVWVCVWQSWTSHFPFSSRGEQYECVWETAYWCVLCCRRGGKGMP